MTRLKWQDALSDVEVLAERGEEGRCHFCQKECYGVRYEVVSTLELQGQAERQAFRKAVYPVHPNAILHEVRQLYNVSDRLDSLAGHHPFVSETLISISGSVRNTATLSEVLVATKIAPIPGLDPASA